MIQLAVAQMRTVLHRIKQSHLARAVESQSLDGHGHFTARHLDSSRENVPRANRATECHLAGDARKRPDFRAEVRPIDGIGPGITGPFRRADAGDAEPRQEVVEPLGVHERRVDGEEREARVGRHAAAAGRHHERHELALGVHLSARSASISTSVRPFGPPPPPYLVHERGPAPAAAARSPAVGAAQPAHFAERRASGLAVRRLVSASSHRLLDILEACKKTLLRKSVERLNLKNGLEVKATQKPIDGVDGNGVKRHGNAE